MASFDGNPMTTVDSAQSSATAISVKATNETPDNSYGFGELPPLSPSTFCVICK